MDSILNTAAYIIQRYKEITGNDIDELKLHKLLYFTQRDSISVCGEPAFDGVFEGWMYGPVSKDVRRAFRDRTIFSFNTIISDDVEYVANMVIANYGTIDSWKLSKLTHDETSWIKSRHGLQEGISGHRVIELSDIIEDAKKVRQYDTTYDMYFDEFEDVN